MKSFTWMCWFVACMGMLAGCMEPDAETPGTSTVLSLDERGTPPPPAPSTAKITIVPSQVELGETATIRIMGHQSAFFTFLSTVSITPASPAIEIVSVQRLSTTELRARVIFHDYGTTGLKSLTVTRCSSAGVACSAKLTVKPDPTPPSVTVNPSWIHQGETANRTFIGRNTHFDMAYTTIISETHGLSFTPLNFVRGRLWVEVTASPTVPIGTHSYTITTLGENVQGTIEVIPPAALTQVTPNVIVQDEDPVEVTVTGSNTHFAPGNTTVSVSGVDVSATDLMVDSPTSLRVKLQAARTAPATVRTLTVTTSSVGESSTIPLTVAHHAPLIPGITPQSGRQGESTPVVLTLDYVDCATEVQSLRSSAGTVRIDGCAGASTLRATVTCQETTPLGPMTLTLTTTWGATVSIPFTVLKGTPWMGMSPATLPQWTINALMTADLHYDVWTPTVSVVSTNCAQLVIHDVQRTSNSRVSFRVDVPLVQVPDTCALMFSSGVESDPMTATLTIRERTLNVESTGQVTGAPTPAAPIFVKITANDRTPLRIRATAAAFMQVDPVITLSGADANFLSPLATNDDEHEATLDAMVLFIPPAPGVFYARVTDRLNLSSGNVTVDVAAFEPPDMATEVESNDTWDATALQPPDVAFVQGELSTDDATDVFTFAIPEGWNGAVVQVLAQGIMPEFGVNALLRLRDGDTYESLGESDDTGPWPDPRLFIADISTPVQAELTYLSGGSHYWLVWAPAMQISEVFHDEANGWMGSFVELSGPPGASLAACELRLTPQGQTARVISLTEETFDAFGWFVAAHDDWVPGAQLLDPQLAVDDPLGTMETVLVSLYCDGSLQSEVCYCPTTAICPAGCVESMPGEVLGQGLMVNRWFLPQPEATPRAANPGKVP